MTGRPKPASDTLSSIYLGKDDRWHGRVTMGQHLDGSVDRKHLSRKTKAELVRAVRELERLRDNGDYLRVSERPTLDGWLAHWLDEIKPLEVRSKTLGTYRSLIKIHVLPTLAGARLDARA